MKSEATKLFCKPLSQTDIAVRLSVPMESLGAFEIPKGEFKVDFKAIDIEGEPWTFRLSTRENDVHPKPVLSAGWLAYVQKKRLRKNDKLLLHVEHKEKKKEIPSSNTEKSLQAYGKGDVEKFEKDVKRVLPTKVLLLD